LEFRSFDGFSIPAALYEPERANDGIILYLHGGGWVCGSIDTHDCLCRKIANALRVRVMSIEYRLAPEHRFPVALNDVVSVYREMFDRKMDFNDVILAGDSAGGNLSAAACIKLREIGFPPPSAQILFYPSLSNDFHSDSFVKFGQEENLPEPMARYFLSQYTGKDLEDEEMRNNKLLYPLLENDMSVFPKTLVVSAERDVLLDGQLLFVQKLRNAGGDVFHTIIEGSKHGFMSYGEDHAKYAKIAIEWIRDLRFNR
jgi:acetyl esterase